MGRGFVFWVGGRLGFTGARIPFLCCNYRKSDFLGVFGNIHMGVGISGYTGGSI